MATVAPHELAIDDAKPSEGDCDDGEFEECAHEQEHDNKIVGVGRERDEIADGGVDDIVGEETIGEREDEKIGDGHTEIEEESTPHHDESESTAFCSIESRSEIVGDFGNDIRYAEDESCAESHLEVRPKLACKLCVDEVWLRERDVRKCCHQPKKREIRAGWSYDDGEESLLETEANDAEASDDDHDAENERTKVVDMLPERLVGRLPHSKRELSILGRGT